MALCPRFEFDDITVMHDFNILVNLFFMLFNCEFMMSLMKTLPYLRIPRYKKNLQLLAYAEMFYRLTLSDTINGFVCIRIVGGHPFLWQGTPIFQLIIGCFSN